MFCLVYAYTMEFSAHRDIDQQVLATAKKLMIDSQESVSGLLRLKLERRHVLLNDAFGVKFLTKLLDICYHTSSAKREVLQLKILYDQGLPKGLPWYEKLAFKYALLLGSVFPKFVCHVIEFYIRFEVRDLIYFERSASLKKLVLKRKIQGVNLNFNKLGEAVLSDLEAEASLQSYLRLLDNADIEFLSVKLSSLAATIDPLSFEKSHELLVRQFSFILRKASNRRIPVFITLDMESYLELPLTVSVFQTVLSDPEFFHISSGIALQAYLKESFEYQKQLTKWALKRVYEGGSPIKIRLVKGANLAMERWLSASRNWPLPTFLSKRETDFNFKKMIRFALQAEHLKAIRVGIGSHNVFDIAYVLELKKHLTVDVVGDVTFELLEGMAPGLIKALKMRHQNVLSYCPLTTKSQFRSGLAYLVRRLDEQTAAYHMIKDFIHLYPDSPLWESYEEFWLSSLKESVSQSESSKETVFMNAPDTPFHQLVTFDQRDSFRNHCFSFSHEFSQSASDLVDKAVSRQHYWKTFHDADKLAMMKFFSNLVLERRAEIVALMGQETRKTIREADAEVSEALDFIAYYSEEFEKLRRDHPDLILNPLGVVVITSPWNFPFAIPIGGIVAALLTGNVVIFKPAPEATNVGRCLAELIWQSGIPKDVFQLALFESESKAAQLIQDKRVKAVVLTGSNLTAQLFLNWRPDLHLLAETGGKNSMIVSSFSDKDLVIQDVVYSAFAHSGQKCSALSLLILPKEVYQDTSFLSRLKYVAQSLIVSDPTFFESQMPPLIRKPSEELLRALTKLEEGEAWLLKPECLNEEGTLWSPGIKLGVKKGSLFYNTECFGPVLGVMKAESFEQCIDFANHPMYGLTAGLHSLDGFEQELWKSKMEAGNLYINRTMTGALVYRQPFGGWKSSHYGYGYKAGGPNYLFGFFELDSSPILYSTLDDLFLHVQYWTDYYARVFSHSSFFGQENLFRYLPYSSVTLRIHSGLTFHQLLVALSSALLTSPHVVLSVSQPINLSSLPSMPHQENLQIVVESFDACISRVISEKDSLLRCTSPQFYLAVEKGVKNLSKGNVDLHAKFEVLKYLKEQSISHTTHRYGL